MKQNSLLTFFPEFQRQIWLELTLTRLVIMPVVLSLIFSTVYELKGFQATAALVNIVFGILTILWATRQVVESFTEELRERTWDTQRLSAASASSLVLGKLFGSTIYVWYGGALCIALQLILFPESGWLLPSMIAGALLGQAASLFMAILLQQMQSRRSMAVAQLFGIAAAFLLLQGEIGNFLSAPRKQISLPATIEWYGHVYDHRNFYLSIGIIFFLWLIAASIRLLRRELGFRDGPLAWLGFTIFIIVLSNGFIGEPFSSSQAYIIISLPALYLTYLSLLFQRVSVVPLKKLIHAIREKKAGNIWREVPSWFISFLAFICLFVWSLVSGEKNIHIGVFIGILGFVSRDILLVYGCRLHYPRRSGSVIALLFFLLYGLGPLATGAFNFHPTLLLTLFIPAMNGWLPGMNGWFCVVPWVEVLFVIFAFRDLSTVFRHRA